VRGRFTPISCHPRERHAMKLTTEQLTDVFCLLLEHFGNAPAEGVREMRAQFAAKPPSRKGTVQAINDFLAHSQMYRKEDRDKVEQVLAARQLPSLRVLEAALKKKHRRILSRGRITNDEEFYIVADILATPDIAELTEAERTKLGEMSRAYEGGKAKG
jgi:hypothetical protein